ncbi:hypothetical protein OWV82_015049 [Melia azedarach]|uniref:Uncharacterized protein n=1 Tax=Melia azedarach TaxID=155640 RepID=A0ACC1XPN8_MELAZ|nr:hypothetical protein OWV82_015049 [Melia azedarach]
MMLAGIPISVIVILLVAAILVLKYSLLSSPFFLFSLFNIIIFAIMVASYRPYTYEVDELFPFFCGSDELGVDTHDNIKEYSDEDDEDCGDEYHGSDGYDEDDDDNGSEGEVGWEDEEGSDGNLQKRIEDFIAKVNDRWREEKLRDKIGPG